MVNKSSNVYYFAGCIASDIGGFVFGNLFKGPKLTKISPKKTVSGSIGSFFLCCIVVMGLVFYITKKFSLNIFFISIIISFSCQLEIYFSYLKRKAKLRTIAIYYLAMEV